MDLILKDRVAIVVYGEQPYAEMHGDIQFALYNTGEPLAQLKRLQRETGMALVACSAQNVKDTTAFLRSRSLT